jgi:chitinase
VSRAPTTTVPTAPAYTTLTVYTTTVYTTTSCAPTVTNCPANLRAVTTDTIIDYTTVCPVSEAISKGLIAYPTVSSESTTTTSLTIVKMITETVKPAPYTPTKYTPTANYTVAGTTALTYSSSPSSSPISFKGAASGLQAGSSLAMVVAAAALFF